MIRDIPPLAVEGVDPWEKVQIDPAARRLAEYAAAAAGLAVEEWLERAIRRACPSAFRTASVTIPSAPIVAPTVAPPSFVIPSFAAPGAATPGIVEPTFAVPPAPPPSVAPPQPVAPPPPQPLAQPPEIEASLAALLARARQQSQAPHSEPPVEGHYAAPPEIRSIAPIELPPLARPGVARATPTPMPLPSAPPAPEPPAALRRPQTLAERLSQQRFDEDEAEPHAFTDEPSDDRDWPEEDEDTVMPRMFAASEQAPADEADAEPKRRFKLWATRDDAEERAAAPHAQPAQPQPPSRRNNRRLAFIAVGLALAVTAGAVTAQFLIPGNTHLARLSDMSGSTSSTAPIFAPTQSNPPPVPNFDGGNNAQSASLPDLSLPPAGASSAAPGSSAAVNATPNALPPVPGLPSLPPSDNSAPTNLASLPPSLPPSATPSVPPPAPEPLPLPTPSNNAATAAPEPTPAPVPAPRQSAAKPARPAPAAKTKATPGVAAAPSKPPAGASVTAAISGGRKPDADEAAPTDPKLLAPWLEQRAKSGDVIAQYRLGVLYALGQGVQQDYQHAAQLFKTSAEGGVAEAQYNIAVMYGEGLGIGRDPTLAVQWYQKAAAQGNANAAFNLGVAYSNGVGVQQDMDQAAQWFRRAAAAGIINAQFNLGLLYERGDGVPVSQVEAYAWYSAAAAHGDSGAAQRRDRLASALAPSTLKEAQARAQQIAATIQTNSSGPGAGALATSTAADAHPPTALSP